VIFQNNDPVKNEGEFILAEHPHCSDAEPGSCHPLFSTPYNSLAQGALLFPFNEGTRPHKVGARCPARPWRSGGE
jgi:hypothetical protein